MSPSCIIFPQSSSCCFVLFCSILLLLSTYQFELYGNFNSSKISQIITGDPISLPIIISATADRRLSYGPSEMGPSVQSSVSVGSSRDQSYRLKRYELKDTKYKPQQHQLNQDQQAIIYNMQPPASIFDVSRIITIEDYQLLEIRNIKIMLINPTDKFRFCINEIYSDSDSIKRIQQKKLPFCLHPSNKYPFFFNIYITEHKPLLFRASVYFIISIYEGNQLVDQKIWPREIIAKVIQNHLKLTPVEVKNCAVGGTKNLTTITILNPLSHHIRVSFENQQDANDNSNQKQVMIPSQKNLKMPILSRQSVLSISTRTYQGSLSDYKYPKLFLPIYCVKPLEINHFHIGVLNTDRSTMEILVPVTSHSKQIIEIKAIQVHSSTSTIEVQKLHEQEGKVPPESQHFGVCRLLAHVSKQFHEETVIEVKIFYFLQSSPKQILEQKNIYKFYELRNPLSLGARRFIDLKKPQQPDPIMSNIFPIRNNLNLPLLLIRVIFDQKIFKLTWLKDRRQHIYPNQQRDEFSLQYVGPRQLKISPVKYIMMLQFNGNLLIPIQIVVFDHTLQCVYNDIRSKCENMGMIDYGYFRNSATKVRQIKFRNWNPTPKQIKIRLEQNPIEVYGMNITMSISKPSPNYDILFKSANNTILFYLKGNHYITLYITISPLANATSGQPTFQISTENELIEKKIKFNVENGTIALIPQILRIGSAYDHAVQYLNLVSTFSQPYKIKSTLVNNSFLNVFFNNHSLILENQWIGLALVYNPFQNNITQSKSTTPSGPLSTSTSTVVAQGTVGRLTQNCCGHQFILNSFINQLYHGEFKRFTYVSVRVITTTELQANATIIIDNNPPKMISQDSFIIEMIKYANKKQQSSNNNGSNKPTEKQNKQNKDFRIKLRNVFKQYVKYRPIIIPKFLYEDTKQFVTAMKRVRKNYQSAMLCVNNAIAVKHNFSPQMVKMILGLDVIPQEITIQPLDNEEYYVGTQKKNGFDSSAAELTPYVRKTVQEGARVCYKMNITKYLKELIQSHILNDIAESYSSQIFHQFVEKEMEFNNFNNTPLYYLEEDQFYDNLDYDFDSYCKKSIYPFFRFCKRIGVAVLPHTQTVLQPGGEHEVIVRAISKSKETSQSFYLVLLNNITKYEAHLIKINITEPKLKIKKFYVQQLSSKQNGRSNREQNQVIHKSFSHESFIRKYLTKKDMIKISKMKQIQGQESDMIKKQLSNVALVLLSASDMQNDNYETERVITISNVGNIDINITYVGFQSQEKICSFNGISLNDNFCNGFKIKSGQEINLTLKVNLNTKKLNQINIFNLYLYNENYFYFNVAIVVKVLNMSGSGFFYKSVNTHFVNMISLSLVAMVILRLKKQMDQKQKDKRKNLKQKIMSTSNYYVLGTKIERKIRKLQPIPQEQIIAVKQIQEARQNKFKQFFNSSGQSQIAKRQQTEEDQPSNFQILNALRQDRNSMSVSEQSSIDFIDLNTLNKSSQNIEEDEENKVFEEEEEYKEQEVNSNSKQNEQEQKENESQPDSDFNDGEQIDYSKVKQDYDWGNPSQQKKKQQQSNSYYNVFFSQNPLKKNESAGLFHWMQDYQRSHR